MTKAEALEVIAKALDEYIEASRKMRSKVTIEDFGRWLEGCGDGSEVEI